MALSTVTCSATSNFSALVRKTTASTSQPASQGLPLTPQFHWARPQTATFAATSNAVEPYEVYRSRNGNFVRPDLVDAADEALAAFIKKTNRPSNSTNRPQFRSALEQVSFETSNSLMEASEAKPKNQQRGLLGKAARILRF